MTIESGTTKDRRIRVLIFLVMCLAFSAWFARDGFWGYPAKTLHWAQQILPEKPADLATNPKVVMANLKQVKPGMTSPELTALLGKPALVHEQNHYYVGPAAYGIFEVTGDKVGAVVKVVENGEPSESDIRNQKYFAGIMAIAALTTLIHGVRISKMRVVLDDTGLAIAGRRIAWDMMAGLATKDYARKGWLDLEYRTGNTTSDVRLDSYCIERFDEIIAAICEKKGFPSPLKPRQDEEPESPD